MQKSKHVLFLEKRRDDKYVFSFESRDLESIDYFIREISGRYKYVRRYSEQSIEIYVELDSEESSSLLFSFLEDAGDYYPGLRGEWGILDIEEELRKLYDIANDPERISELAEGVADACLQISQCSPYSAESLIDSIMKDGDVPVDMRTAVRRETLALIRVAGKQKSRLNLREGVGVNWAAWSPTQSI